jgi:quinol monooxygenase YgiN
MSDAPLITTISQGEKCVTLINVFFTSGPEDQDKLIKIAIDATEEVMRYQPGFISANFHRSYDGSAVVNYAQWRSTEHWSAALQKPEVQEHIKIIKEHYKMKAALYQVVHISHAADPTTDDPV